MITREMNTDSFIMYDGNFSKEKIQNTGEGTVSGCGIVL
jgi:hypothetical protein